MCSIAYGLSHRNLIVNKLFLLFYYFGIIQILSYYANREIQTNSGNSSSNNVHTLSLWAKCASSCNPRASCWLFSNVVCTFFSLRCVYCYMFSLSLICVIFCVCVCVRACACLFSLFQWVCNMTWVLGLWLDLLQKKWWFWDFWSFGNFGVNVAILRICCWWNS